MMCKSPKKRLIIGLIRVKLNIDKNHHGLKELEISHVLVNTVHTFTERFHPVDFPLTKLVNDAAIRAQKNIEESAKKNNLSEISRHLRMASGALAELKTHLNSAENLNYVSPQVVNELILGITQLSGMLHNIQKI